MDMTVVNISGVDGVSVGDIATLIGTDGADASQWTKWQNWRALSVMRSSLGSPAGFLVSWWGREVACSLLEAAAGARENAYAPYSEYPVGAALEVSDGSVFLGSNVENSSLSMTICAERRRWRLP